MRLLLPLLALAIAGMAPGDADAQWKWRDARGQVTVSDLPPPRDVPEKDILQRPPTSGNSRPSSALPAAAVEPALAASAPASAPAGVDPELEARRKAVELEQTRQKQEQTRREEVRLAQQRAENCERARESLRTLESGMRIGRVNEKGERIVIDDRERAAETERARQAVAANCR